MWDFFAFWRRFPDEVQNRLKRQQGSRKVETATVTGTSISAKGKSNIVAHFFAIRKGDKDFNLGKCTFPSFPLFGAFKLLPVCLCCAPLLYLDAPTPVIFPDVPLYKWKLQKNGVIAVAVTATTTTPRQRHTRRKLRRKERKSKKKKNTEEDSICLSSPLSLVFNSKFHSPLPLPPSSSVDQLKLLLTFFLTLGQGC